ncbi:WecB/TagA/CpsF family glycosyltransferase [Rhizobiaceae bacterium BDR2-2]|uniref:WecB/TagA/CpsF family glycosyltransferase n=1 Tax=Ectorhizobium quercum TaxID=2965071 RepID=A0AAE3SVY8_9HYPH|nr:WecB/TagA/CpsF family glycosyltransferase [Ectorhizobium quercum]MCX8996136.1 WecB/TagA/CpsF family glycosyltransferase [Ectorhizobium quercum]MCX8998825.1 WecB/TagA/CpsF family glycosyltransferase [Ectorhizobium quercum]
MNIAVNFGILASKRAVLDVPVCDLDWDSALAFTNQLANVPTGQTVIAFLNAHNANLMMKFEDYHELLQNQLVFPDGFGLDIASALLHGEPFPANLNGTDFIPALMTYMSAGKRIGLVGATPEVLEDAAGAFRRRCPWHTFIPVSDGYLDHEKSLKVIEKIETLGLDVLVVCMGTPRQERWVARYIRPEHARLVMTGGALFDFVSGRVPRASHLLRSLRLEWAYRFWNEPRRLAGRYLVGIPIFFFHLLRFRFGKRALPSYMRLAEPLLKPTEKSKPERPPLDMAVGKQRGAAR